ncbi:MAG: CDGSH-type iron sulfur-containing protein [Myxococcales bacterium]|nr:CDGSH-type iron sulfur-containing protein [Myxococcales bacterium]
MRVCARRSSIRTKPKSPARSPVRTPTREHLVHSLYEAAELEHNLMCTYLYAAFSLKTGETEGLTAAEAEAVARWRSAILEVSIEEMGHLVAVWNITSALGGSPRFGRGNFPLDPGSLPASVVVKLAPFSAAALQHFVHLERPTDSQEPDGEGFASELRFSRAAPRPRVTPMGFDYETVGAFYATLDADLRAFVAHHGEQVAFCGDPALQLSTNEVERIGTKPVICLKTALAAFAAIVEQGEGAPGHADRSHFQKFAAIREELATMRAANPAFAPAFPAAHNPVLRPPLRPQGRVWIENEEAAQTVDLANAAYGLMLRLLAFSYVVPRPSSDKRLAVDLSLGLMRAVTHLAERAVRLPAGPSNPSCNAGVSFTSLRDASPFPPGSAARRFFLERFEELVELASAINVGDSRVAAAARIINDLHVRAKRGFAASTDAGAPIASAREPVKLPVIPPTPTKRDGVEYIEGEKLTLIYEGPKCIHSRFCVTGAPMVFLANVKGPWIHPDAMPVDRLVEIAHACPSGAIRYERKDGAPNETAPPVNLISIRENGPYAVRAEIRLDGAAAEYRATLCRCGASKNKPFCDGSHHTIDFAATGEPLTESADMLAVRDGTLEIDPQIDGPLQVRGNLEITSGTGRVVARIQQAKLCRCGGSKSKPFCDGTHQRIGFRSGQ